MNNTDFQRLLCTNDKQLVKELTQPSAKKKNKRPMPEGKGKGKKDGKGKGKGEIGGLEPKQPEYRDRATERRENKGEYEQIAAEWENQAELTIENSKYIGGDLAHTHLVKGLDFALLSKVRNEITKKKNKDDLHDQRLQKKTKKQQTFTSILSKKVWHTIVETLHPHHRTFSQRLQGMSKAISMGQRIRGAPSTFLPGRMEYEFDIADHKGNSDIPRIIYMSKEDAPKVDWSKKVASVLPQTVAKVHDCLHRAIEERKRRKLERTQGTAASYALAQKLPAPIKHKAKDLDEDIFGGVGGFNGAEIAANAAAKKKAAEERAKKGEGSASASGAKRPSYFDDAGAEKYRQAPADVQLDLADITVEEIVGGSIGGGEAAFEASSKWRGARPGWAFKLGAQGLGYYLDDKDLAARDAARKAAAAALKATKAAPSGRQPMRQAKQPSSKGFVLPNDDDDAYGDCFPSAMMANAGVRTGDDDGSDEEDGTKSKIEKLKKLAEKGKKGKDDSVETSSYGKKGKDVDEKKRKKTENQEWQKIDSMIKSGKHGSIDELEAQASKKRRSGPAAPREIFSTPAFF